MRDNRDLPDLQVPIEVVPMGPDLVSVLVRGEIDLREAGELRAVLADACSGAHRSVLVDLSDVHFIGSSGLGVLARVSHELHNAGRTLMIRGCRPALIRAFEVTGLSRVLDVS